jgi:histidine triad (HIT) family protein
MARSINLTIERSKNPSKKWKTARMSVYWGTIGQPFPGAPDYEISRGASMRNCIFCRIVAGEIPACRVYEDELVLAFLDIAPINPGHLLVIPKEHHTSAGTIPEETAGRMFRVGARLGVACRRALDMDGYNLHLADGTAAGQVVMHAHLHVVPRGVEDGFRWNWRQLAYRDDGERDERAAQIREKLKLDPAPEENA